MRFWLSFIFLSLFTGCAHVPLGEMQKSSQIPKPVFVPFTKGTHFTVSQGPFGNSHNEKGNEYNWDFDVPEGTDVLSVEDGTIIDVWTPQGGSGCDPKYAEFAHNIKVEHQDLTVAQYVHVTPTVKAGQKVKAGTKIAKTAINGWICKPHLHFGIYRSKGHLYNSPDRETLPLMFLGIEKGTLVQGDAATASGIRVWNPSLSLKISEIKPRVFVVTHKEPWPSNSLIVEMKNSELLMVDTPYTKKATKELLSWMKGHFGKRKITAINTHFHADRLGGNESLLKQSIPIHGSDLTAKLLAERGEKMRQMLLSWLSDERMKKDFRRAKFVPPNRIFNLPDGLSLKFGEESAQVFFPGPAHSPDNVVVFFPELKILFAGCMVISLKKVGNTSDADLAAWPETLEKLKRFDAAWVIPGHGELYSPDLIDHTMTILKNP